MNPERSTANPYRTVRTQALYNQFSSRHPGHKNWISLKGQTIIEKEKHFCSLIAQNGPEWVLTEIRNATAKKSYKSRVQLRIPEKTLQRCCGVSRG